MAIRSFRDKVSQEICDGIRTKQSSKRLPPELHPKAQIKLARLAAATNLNDLADLRGNRLESLKGDRVGQYTIRINDQFRICFRWVETDAFDVEITDCH